MLVLKELKQRTFWATQANRKWRKDRLPLLARDSKWRACSQAMWNSWLVVRPKLPREQPLIIIHIQIIYSFLIFLNLSTNYWMRLRPKTHENCIILHSYKSQIQYVIIIHFIIVHTLKHPVKLRSSFSCSFVFSSANAGFKGMFNLT